jgi:hypothetical protein
MFDSAELLEDASMDLVRRLPAVKPQDSPWGMVPFSIGTKPAA